MNSNQLNTRYRIEIYENSFINNPAAAFDVASPFPPINVGDHIDHRTLASAGSPENALRKDKTFRVKAVNHLAREIGGSHVVHSLSFCVEVIPQPK
jgi:hypothetical protein